jgi:colicin import membrane protein
MTHDALLPRPPGGLAPGAALSLLVHALLLAGLTVAVDWRMKAPEMVSAELWASLPQVAAPKAEPAPAPAPAPVPTPISPMPPAPPPPTPAPPALPPPAPIVKAATPAPPPPDIATERAEKRRLEQDRKAEAKKEAADRAKQQAAQDKAEEVRLAKARAEQMKRMFGSLSASGPSTNTGSAAQDAAPSQAYIARLIAQLRNSVRYPDNLPGNPAVEVRVQATPSGTILSRVVTKKSGVDEYDAAVLRGLDRLGTLQRDENGRVPQDLLLTFRPKE